MNTDGVAEVGPPWALGFIAGVLTAAGVYALYPPGRDRLWPIWTLAGGSILFIVAVYVAGRILGAIRAADSLVVGYGLALVLAASLVVTRELVHAVREHVPENLGVKRVELSPVEVPG